MDISALWLIIAFLGLLNSLQFWQNHSLVQRLYDLNKDCVQVLTAMDKVLERIEATANGNTLDLRLAIGDARDRIIETLKSLLK